jgi:hypothetical protein
MVVIENDVKIDNDVKEENHQVYILIKENLANLVIKFYMLCVDNEKISFKNFSKYHLTFFRYF